MKRLPLLSPTSLCAMAAALLACTIALASPFGARAVRASAPVKARSGERRVEGLEASERRSDNSAPDASTQTALKSAYGRLPMSFVANDGQFAREVRYSARGGGYQLFLTENGATLALDAHHQSQGGRRDQATTRGAVDDSHAQGSSVVLRMKLLGARRAARVSGEGPADGRVNYLIGDDPAKWRTNIATFSAVRYAEVYAGVDLVYYGSQQQLEYDFHIAPHADPRQIKIRFEGATEVKIDAEGQLLLRAGAGYVKQRKPVAYQLIGDVRREIPSRYFVNARREVGFHLSAYDHSLPLIIDPVLSYATYLGGSLSDQANSVAVDAAGNAYITGQTGSLNFPTNGALQAARAGRTDVFVTKLNPAGTALVYSTYLGGSLNDIGNSIAIDASGNAYVTGSTLSTDFPHTAGAFQQSKSGGSDAFVAKLSASGNALVYSTFLGGNNAETGYGVGVDAAGNAYVAGFTNSTIFNGTPTPKRGSPAYRSTDAGNSWSANNNGLPDVSLSGITVDPTNHLTLYAAGSSVFKSTDGGTTWVATAPFPSIPGVNGTLFSESVAVDPVAPSTIYAASFFGIFKSTDAGNSWAISDQGDICQQVIVDPTNHLTLYAATLDGVIKSTDGGATWTTVDNGIPGFATSISRLIFDPSNTNTIYAGTNEGIYKTTNGALKWTLASTGLTSFSPPQIDSLAIDPLTPSTVYASVNVGVSTVYKSTDSGASWHASGNGLPANADVADRLAIDPLTPSTLYAVGSLGVYKTTDGGANWSASNNGLANKIVYDVAVDPVAPSRVYLATDAGRDAFVAKLDQSGGTLGYLVYLGGDEDDVALGIAVDAAGDAYTTGWTASTNFPVTNPLRASSGGFSDAFVAKLTPAGSVAYSTYLGGDGYEIGAGIALDGQGRAYVTGYTTSSNFPTTITRKQPDTFASDIFVTRLASNGASLDYSFLHGGSDFESGNSVAVDTAGNAYVTGQTSSFDFPLLNPAQTTQAGVFLLKVDPSGNPALSTYLGGASPDDNSLGVATDNNGSAYIVGKTSAANFPVTSTAFQRTLGGSTDAFAIKLQIGNEVAPQVQFSQPNYQASEGAGRATLTVTRTGDASSPLTVSYQTVDDPAAVRCDDTTNNHGAAYARCDYSTTLDSVSFAAGDTTPKQITVPLIDDAHVEGDETVQVRLFNPTGATLGAQSTATLTILDNDVAGEPNPILQTPLFVRMQYLDFLSREPEAGEPWSATLNNCATGDTSCDRISVSANFFRSQEFQLKGLFVFRFYKVSYGRLPLYFEIVADMRAVTGSTTAELQAKKATFTNSWVQRQEFKSAYDGLSNQQFVDALMSRYNLQQVTTPDPMNPDSGSRTSFTRAGFVAALNIASLSRAQVVRAIADSDEVGAAEFNSAFVAMQYFGYLRRDPEPGGYNAWLATINANPADFRSMVNGFMNSTEYRLRFGQP